MKNYSYNKSSKEGRRLFRLLDTQFNSGVITPEAEGKTFKTYDVKAVMQCRANKIGFLLPSNLSGIKRPQVHVSSDVELAWGEFTQGVSTLDFTHGNQELPLTYVSPLDDEALKLLIDAGLYSDGQFEQLISKLMKDEVFDAEANMNVTHLDIGSEVSGEMPFMLVDPIHVAYEDQDPSEQTTINDLVKRSALLAIELRKDGVSTSALVSEASMGTEKDPEVYIGHIEDVVAQREAEQEENANSFAVSSELLDQEIDVTEKLRGSLGYNQTSEDTRIQELKELELEDLRELSGEPQGLPVEGLVNVGEFRSDEARDMVNTAKQSVSDEIVYITPDDDGPEL